MSEEKWTLRPYDATGRVLIIVEGFATEHRAREAAIEFKRILGSRQLELLFDLEKMTGYAPGVRKHWQECLIPLRSQISRLVVLGKVSSIVKMAATVVGAAAGIRIVFYRTMHEASGERLPRASGE